MSDGATVRNDLENLTTRLDEVGRKQDLKQSEFDEASQEFEEIWNDLLVAFIEPYKALDGKLSKLPGEDVRNALITKQFRELHPEEFGRYHRLKRELAQLEKEGRRIEKMIFSKQSSLSWLKTEAQAIG